MILSIPDSQRSYHRELSRSTAVSSAALHGPGDVGRRVAREAVTSSAAVAALELSSGTTGGAGIAGWAVIGVIVAYFPSSSSGDGPPPAKRGRAADSSAEEPTEVPQMGLEPATGLWRVVFGDGSEQMMDEVAVHTAIFRFRSLISSAAAQIKSLVTPDMLDLKLIPPYFAQFSATGTADTAATCPYCQCAVHEDPSDQNEDVSVVACGVCTKRAHAACCGVPPGPDGRVLVWVCEQCMEIQDRFYYCAKCLKELKSLTAYKYHRKTNVCNKKMLVAAEKLNRMKARRPIVRKRHRMAKGGDDEDYSAHYAPSYEEEEEEPSPHQHLEHDIPAVDAVPMEETQVPAETFVPSKAFVDFAVLENYLEPLWHFNANSMPYITISQWVGAFLSSASDQRDSTRFNSLWSIVPVDIGSTLPNHESESFDTLNAAARSGAVVESLQSAPNLGPFESCVLPGDGDSVYLNTGGAVTSISFAPFQPLGGECTPNGTPDKVQYFAVAMGSIGFYSERSQEPRAGLDQDSSAGSQMIGPGYLEPLVLGQCRRVDNILQLWSSKNVGLSGSNERSSTLEYAVELRARGAVLQTSWCPFKCHGTVRFEEATASYPIKWRSYLGTLAVVCGDGLCLVLMLPSKHHGNVLASTGWGVGPEAPVLPENSVCRFMLGTGDTNDYILCAEWSQSHPFQLFCGHRDGAVSVWNLDSNAVLRVRNPAVWLSDSLTPRTSVIRVVRACPYNSDWIATGGQDAKIRVRENYQLIFIHVLLFIIYPDLFLFMVFTFLQIWSILYPSKPLFTIQHIYSNSILDLAWDTRGNGIISAYSGSSWVSFDSTFSHNVFALNLLFAFVDNFRSHLEIKVENGAVPPHVAEERRLETRAVFSQGRVWCLACHRFRRR